MHIDAVTISIDYSDYLDKIASNNKVLDRWLIVTHELDKKTINVCNKHKLEYIFSERIYDNDVFFAKSRAINEGLQYIKPKEWILHIDSDTLLPKDFKSIMESIDLDKHSIYGADRVHETNGLIEQNSMSSTGFPWGYLQLWHADEFKSYYEKGMIDTQGDYEHADQFNTSSQLPFTVTDVQNVEEKNWSGRSLLTRARHMILNSRNIH